MNASIETPATLVPRQRQDDGLTVLLVDHHRLVTESLAGLLPELPQVRATLTAGTLSAARDLLRRGGIDLVLVDDVVNGGSGLDLIHAEPPGGRAPLVMIFSARADPRRIAEALLAGAVGWMAQDCRREELVSALRTVGSGRRWVAPRLRSSVIDALVRASAPGSAAAGAVTMSARRWEVLRLLADGLSHGETAERLGLSLSTVRTHVRHMCQALGVHSTPELVAMVWDGRLVPPRDETSTRPK